VPAGPIAGIETRATRCRQRLQAREAESAIGGTIHKIIHVMLVIVARLIIRQFLGSL
jgi:hypothetical protein